MLTLTLRNNSSEQSLALPEDYSEDIASCLRVYKQKVLVCP